LPFLDPFLPLILSLLIPPDLAGITTIPSEPFVHAALVQARYFYKIAKGISMSYLLDAYEVEWLLLNSGVNISFIATPTIIPVYEEPLPRLRS
jgi:hypothetical protein